MHLSRRLALAILATAVLGGGEAADAVTAHAVTANAARRPAFTIKNARLRVINGRLDYLVAICTPVKSVLHLQATFTPQPKGRGAVVLRPGETQYQPAGCWPALVSAQVRSKDKSCSPIACPAIAGRRYKATVKITDTKPHRVTQAPTEQAVA